MERALERRPRAEFRRRASPPGPSQVQRPGLGPGLGGQVEERDRQFRRPARLAGVKRRRAAPVSVPRQADLGAFGPVVALQPGRIDDEMIVSPAAGARADKDFHRVVLVHGLVPGGGPAHDPAGVRLAAAEGDEQPGRVAREPRGRRLPGRLAGAHPCELRRVRRPLPEGLRQDAVNQRRRVRDADRDARRELRRASRPDQRGAGERDSNPDVLRVRGHVGLLVGCGVAGFGEASRRQTSQPST